MTAIELNQAKIKVEALFQSAIDGEEVIITQNEKPILKLVRVDSLLDDDLETNALEKLQKIRISASADFSTKANLYSIEDNQ